MTRSSFIQLCVYLTLGLSLGAAGWKLAHTSAARMAGAQLFPLIGPVFFALAAKNAIQHNRAVLEDSLHKNKEKVFVCMYVCMYR